MSDAIQTFGPTELEALFQQLGVKPHPVLRLPTVEQVRLLLATPEGRTQLIEQLKRRQERIRLAEQDPLEWNFEPETWADADRLLADCRVLCIFGGNRAQKTWYAIKRAVQTAVTFPKSVQLICSETERTSVATVQALVWYYLEPRYRHLNGKRGDAITKINYSQAGGFTESKLVLPNGSEMYFPSYNQEPGDYEGWMFGADAYVYKEIAEKLKADSKFVPPNVGAVADESMPLAWLKMLDRRVKFRGGKVIWTFTPVKGMTPTIKDVVGASAVTIESRPSELLPRQNMPDIPDGHMPYIRQCQQPDAMAIYFFTVYNRFGPKPGRTYYDEVKELCAGKDSQYVERVAYGYARDVAARAFPKFGPWNVVKRSQLPAVGSNYMVTDPAGARNWATGWVRVTPGDRPSLYIYRDWPDAQTYGEWALPSEREVSAGTRKGWDGERGPAQNSLGFGIVKYKQTFLQCERIHVPVEIEKSAMALTHPELDRILERVADPQHRTRIRKAYFGGEKLSELREEVMERYVDPRAGKNEHAAEQGGTCIIDEFDNVQMDEKTGLVKGASMPLTPASGVDIEEGLMAINELLDWNMDQPLIPIVNTPHLFVCEDCLQIRWMMENYTGRGATDDGGKDFADVLRYMATADLRHVDLTQNHGKQGGGF